MARVTDQITGLTLHKDCRNGNMGGVRHLQQTERNLCIITENICHVCKVQILISCSMYQVLPNGNVIHQERHKTGNMQGAGKVVETKKRDMQNIKI